MKATHILFPVLAFFTFSMILFGNTIPSKETNTLLSEGSIDISCEEVDISAKLELLDLFLKREENKYFLNLINCGKEAAIGLDCRCGKVETCKSCEYNDAKFEDVNNQIEKIDNMIKKYGRDNLISNN